MRKGPQAKNAPKKKVERPGLTEDERALFAQWFKAGAPLN